MLGKQCDPMPKQHDKASSNHAPVALKFGTAAESVMAASVGQRITTAAALDVGPMVRSL
jgi:hypothetical protein